MQEIEQFPAFFGRGDGDRTHDLSVPNAARYQLRYASNFFFGCPINATIIADRFLKVKLFYAYLLTFFLSAKNRRIFLFSPLLFGSFLSVFHFMKDKRKMV